ncbi:hypothetical protein G6F60_015631 [Rhizopus arrhizus]|nr:hypothetical protein G6F60_015631 [Rhizopus arrhizus]
MRARVVEIDHAADRRCRHRTDRPGTCLAAARCRGRGGAVQAQLCLAPAGDRSERGDPRRRPAPAADLRRPGRRPRAAFP